MMKRAVVIGAGLGGLATAIRLAATGQLDVTLLERNPGPGGRAGFFEVEGYHFDAGPTLITEPMLLEDLWQSAGRNVHDDVELIPLDPYYRVYFADGSTIDYSGDMAAMAAQIEALAPGDGQGYRDLLKWAGDVYDNGFMDMGRQPFMRLQDVVGAVPGLALSRAWLSAYTRAGQFVKDERIHQMFSFHPLFIGGNPRRASAIYMVIPYIEKHGGVFYAKGGTASIVQAMETLFTELGGKVVYNADVTELCTDKRRVIGAKLVDGTEYPAEVVVSNADIATTYREMLPGVTRHKYTDRKLDSMKYSMSAFLFYGGVKRKYPNLEVHNVVLGEYDRLLTDIFDKKVIPENPAYYIYMPSRVDPDMAPEGSESFYVLAPVPHLTDNIDWSVEKMRFRDRLLGILEAWGMPGLTENLVVERIVTPDDFARRFRAYRGNAFAFEPRLLQSAYWRPHNRSEEVDGLYFVGAGTHPGAGVPGVIMGAEIAAKLVKQDVLGSAPVR